jgi:hypothetical protein
MYEEIVEKFKSGEASFIETFEELASIGHCPNLLNDDNGHWAVKFDGFQSVPFGDEPDDVETTFFVEKDSWRDTIREALAAALEE